MPSSFTNIEGLFKTVYSDKVTEKMIPDSAVFHKMFTRMESEKLGQDYRAPVELTRPGGYVSSVSSGAYTLNAAVQRKIPQAIVTSASATQIDTMSYPEIAAARKAASQGREAFVNLTKDTTRALVDASAFHAELDYRYGCGAAANDASGAMDNLGEVLTSTQASSGVYDLVLTDASWCSAIWQGQEGNYVDIRNVADGAQITATTYPTITSVTPSTRTIRVTGTEADLANVAVGDHLFWGGPSATTYEQQMVGMVKILQNTGALFNIDVADYSLWGANVFSAGSAPLTFDLVRQAAQRAANVGFTGELTVLTSPDSWSDMLQDMQALVQQPGGAKDEYSIGAGSLLLRNQTGTMRIVSDIYMKRGLTFILPRSRVARLGANEGTFNPTGEMKMFRELDGQAGVELRYFQDKCIYLRTPAHAAIITDIAPSMAAS